MQTRWMIALWLLILPVLSAAAGESPAVARIDTDGIQRVEIVGGSYFFEPNRIIVKINIPVELSVKKKSGLTPHDIVMDSPEAGMKFKVELGTDPKVIGFVPTRNGEFPFFCSKKFLGSSHRAKGMAGVIEVRP